MIAVSRRDAADLLDVSRHTLARAATDAAFGSRAEAAGLLPPVAGYVGNRPVYDLSAVQAVLATREVAALAGRLRAASIRKRIS